MKIFLIRHAEAIDYETDTVKSDDYRFITPNGRSITRKVAKELKEELKDLEIVFTSPLIRAVQTAEIFATRLKIFSDVEVVNELRNECTVASLERLICNNASLSTVALVGHEPKMSLLVKSFSGKNDFIEFSKSSVSLLDIDPVTCRGEFLWYFDSKEMEYIK